MSSLQDTDVTQDDLGVMMMKPVVMVTLPEDTLFHFTVRDDAPRGCCMWDTEASFQDFLTWHNEKIT